LVDAYYDIKGSQVLDLVAQFETMSPSERFRITRLEGQTDSRNNYGWLVRGYLLAPSSGIYRFNVCGDDWVEVFLSPDETVDGKELLCLTPRATDAYQWDKYPEYQVSRPVALEEGKRYYVEVRFKEGWGDDNWALAWLQPNASEYTIVEGAYLAPFVVGDASAPVIELEGETQTTLKVGQEFVDLGFSAFSSTGQDLTESVRVEGSVNTEVAGTYHLRYYVTDENGQEAVAQTRSVTVEVDQQVGATYLADQSDPTLSTEAWAPQSSAITEFEASRFLIQSTFGPNDEAIAELQELGYEAWLEREFNKPASSHLAELDQFAKFRAGRSNLVDRTRSELGMYEMMPSEIQMADISHDDRIDTWWTLAIDGDDQLRQRVAFALSEILVISDYNPVLERYPRGVTNYYDLLVNGAFGNFRDLLEEVSLNPMMGFYLTLLRSDAASPDENYAREVMQLFTVGLEELNMDGSKKLNAQGQRQSTYTQDNVYQLARALTGWTFNGSTEFNRSHGAVDSMNPMMPFNQNHDTGEKTIIGGAVLPAGQTPYQDLSQALDVLFNHPNVGPFLARRLIQRLVTSNPSPGYIYRVAHAFNDDGQGVRGNLKAVIRAVLMDKEARDLTLLSPERSGQLREPLIRATHLIRAFRKEPSSNPPTLGRFPIRNPYFEIREAPLWAVSVFNFFEPDFQVPGLLMDAGLYSPEFQITNEVSVIDTANYFYSAIDQGFRVNYGQSRRQPLDFSSLAITDLSPAALMDRVETLMIGGSLSQESRDAFIDLYEVYEGNSNPQAYGEAVLQVLMAIPEFAILH